MKQVGASLHYARSASLLLKYRADPNQCELGHSEPIFIAIGGKFPRCVQILITHRANIDVQEDFPFAATNDPNYQSEIILRSRTTIEAAAGCPRIVHMLQDASNETRTQR